MQGAPAPTQDEADFLKHHGVALVEAAKPAAPLPFSTMTPTQDEADFLKARGMLLHRPILPVEHEVPWPTQADADDLVGGSLEVVETAPRSLEVEPPTPTQADADIARRFGLPEPQDVDPTAPSDALQDPTQPEADIYKLMSAGVLEFITAWDNGATTWDHKTTVWDRQA